MRHDHSGSSSLPLTADEQLLWESKHNSVCSRFRYLAWLTFTAPIERSVLDEDHALFGGTYAGANSLPAVREEVEKADFVLMAGKLESDFKWVAVC